jgi:cathepsin L
MVEQNLIDCHTYCSGCEGGIMNIAFGSIKYYQSGSLSLLIDYPDIGFQAHCYFEQTTSIQVLEDNIVLESHLESELQLAVSKYSLPSVDANTSHISFQLYSSDIYDEPACSVSPLNHAVAAIFDEI